MGRKIKTLGIIDADLLDNGTRHPNLACMKISAYYKKQGWEVKLLDSYENLDKYTLVSLSRVFSFTHINPVIFKNNRCLDIDHPEKSLKKNIQIGGTGFYFENAPDLPYEIEHIMPDYHLYDDYINNVINKLVDNFKTNLVHDINAGNKRLKKGQTIESLVESKRNYEKQKFCDYKDFSIGFTTRGCFRKCSFCVNKKYDRVHKHSPVSEFFDSDRKYIYLWDDNFMASPDFDSILTDLMLTKRSFQFRQGLDMRLMTEQKAEKLSKVKYYGDFIFAFDHIKDKDLIEEKLKIWRRYCSKGTKFYVLTAYDSQDETDIKNTFERIKILFKYGCVPYLMRYENYKVSSFKSMYIEMTRWANQQQHVKKQSFRQFAIANEEWHKKHTQNPLGYCSCYRTMLDFESKYPDIAKEYFDMRMEDLNIYKKSSKRSK